jgi:hypothetical protein
MTSSDHGHPGAKKRPVMPALAKVPGTTHGAEENSL